MPESYSGRYAGASLKLKPPWVPYVRFAISVRISCRCHSNRATFSPQQISANSMTYEIRTKSAKSIGSERIGPQRENLGLFPAWPVNRSAPKNPGILPSSGGIGRAERVNHLETGGEGGATGYKRSLNRGMMFLSERQSVDTKASRSANAQRAS